MAVVRGRPPVLRVGNRLAINSHCSLVKSLGYALVIRSQGAGFFKSQHKPCEFFYTLPPLLKHPLSNFRQGDILDEMSFNSKAEYKPLYPNPSELTGFDFPEFLADSNRQSAARSANTQRKVLESQRQIYRDFITEHGESELANTTFLPIIGETLVKLGEAEINAGNLEIARETLQEALEIVNNCHMMKHIALINYHLARLEQFLHNMNLAQIYYACACNILQSLGAVRELKRIQQEWQHIINDCNT